ncbi:MAG: phenylacetic acid degradation operon negative regulatory protein PaaX [Chloroflexi bacterium]|nr:phenylacetic acid degradation operon negative regulatory protein PaaX [Chloroflexota bacterium]
MPTRTIRPQALIFTLFGDYVCQRSDRIWIGSLIRLLALFGVSEQATRTTVSRMTRRGWLCLSRTGTRAGYALTPAASRLIEEGTARIFQPPTAGEGWDGLWSLVAYSIPEEQRESRDRFRRELGWLGYGMLTNALWISPNDRRARVADLVEALQIKPCVQSFSGHLDGFVSCRELAARCWNLADLNAAYAAFIEKYQPQLCDYQRRLTAQPPPEDRHCFAQRFMLTHEYRRFPYRDPRLPAELLPADWRGADAQSLFQTYHRLLADPANRYFDAIFR